jgi:hypothetical protein
MIDPNVDKAVLVDQIVDTIRHRFAISQGKKIIHIHRGVLSFGLPLPPIVLILFQEEGDTLGLTASTHQG